LGGVVELLRVITLEAEVESTLYTFTTLQVGGVGDGCGGILQKSGKNH